MPGDIYYDPIQTAEMAPGSTLAGSSVADTSVSEADLETPLQEVAVTRESVKGLLVESMEIALGRRPMKLTLAISRNVNGKKIRTQKSIEVFARDRQASIGVLKLLGQELDMFKGESAVAEAPIQTVDDDLAWEMLERYRAKHLQRRKEQEEAKRREAEEDHDL